MERWLKESLRQSTGSLMVRLMEQQSKKSQMVLWKGYLMAQCAMVYAHLHHMLLHHNCFSEFDISCCRYTHSSVILQLRNYLFRKYSSILQPPSHSYHYSLIIMHILIQPLILPSNYFIELFNLFILITPILATELISIIRLING